MPPKTNELGHDEWGRFSPILAKRALADLNSELRTITDRADQEQRDLTAAENRDVERIGEQARKLGQRINREKAQLQLVQAGVAADARSDRAPIEIRDRVARNLQEVAKMSGNVSRDLLAPTAEERDIVSTGGYSGLLPTDYQPVWEMLLPHAVALRCGISTKDTERHSVTLPVHTGLPTAAWVAEGGTIPTSDPTGTTTVYTPSKVAVMDKISREAADDADNSLVNMVLNRLAISIGLKIDLGVFEGSGVSPEPTGLKNLGGTQSVTLGSGNGAALTNLDPFASAIELLEAANANATAIVMHPRSWGELLQVKELTSGSNKPVMQASAGAGSQGVQNLIYGVPVYFSTQISTTEVQGTSSTCSSAYVFQADQVIMVRSHAVRLEADTGPFFSTDEIAVRAAARMTVAVPTPAAIVRIKGIL